MSQEQLLPGKLQQCTTVLAGDTKRINQSLEGFLKLIYPTINLKLLKTNKLFHSHYVNQFGTLTAFCQGQNDTSIFLQS